METERKPPPQGQPWLSTPALSQEFDIPVSTLHRWAFEGKGPKYYKLGKVRRYRREDVERWLEESCAKGGDVA